MSEKTRVWWTDPSGQLVTSADIDWICARFGFASRVAFKDMLGRRKKAELTMCFIYGVRFFFTRPTQEQAAPKPPRQRMHGEVQPLMRRLCKHSLGRNQA
jgi:hypothetical protein